MLYLGTEAGRVILIGPKFENICTVDVGGSVLALAVINSGLNLVVSIENAIVRYFNCSKLKQKQ